VCRASGISYAAFPEAHLLLPSVTLFLGCHVGKQPLWLLPAFCCDYIVTPAHATPRLLPVKQNGSNISGVTTPW
jgi:hypothetical protein